MTMPGYRMASIAVLLLVLACTSEASGLATTNKQNEIWGSVKNLLKRVVNFASGLVLHLPPVVTDCMWELTCFATEDDYSKCVWYVTQCISKHVIGVYNCLYDLVGDAGINYAYHGWKISDYDYSQIGWDVLVCGGVDQYIYDWGFSFFKKN